MNRAIICRGKRIDNDEWAEGYLFKSWNRAFLLWGMTGDVPNMIEVKPETVGQYTGLTDKNGKRIFEGDILQFRKTVEIWGGDFTVPQKMDAIPERAAIAYSEVLGRFGFLDSDTPFNEMSVKKFKAEVIGNIYDNPELLEVENE